MGGGGTCCLWSSSPSWGSDSCAPCDEVAPVGSYCAQSKYHCESVCKNAAWCDKVSLILMKVAWHRALRKRLNRRPSSRLARAASFLSPMIGARAATRRRRPAATALPPQKHASTTVAGTKVCSLHFRSPFTIVHFLLWQLILALTGTAVWCGKN